MTTDKIRVTVDGEPVTREVTLEQVRAYLTRKGWKLRREKPNRNILWTRDADYIWMTDRNQRWMIEYLARYEQRHPAEVLRDIAGDDATTDEARAEAERLRAVGAAAMAYTTAWNERECAVNEAEAQAPRGDWSQETKDRLNVLSWARTDAHMALLRACGVDPDARAE